MTERVPAMAAITKKGNGYFCTFRYQNQRYYFAIGKVSEREALAKGAEVDETVALLKKGRLSIPQGVRIEDFVANGGKAPS
jgi:hypothetical protein